MKWLLIALAILFTLGLVAYIVPVRWVKQLMLFIIAILCLSLLASSFGLFVSAERISYELLEQNDQFEMRRYPSRVLAFTEVTSGFTQAMQEGFPLLAAYIFGENEREQKIAMTAPVLQMGQSTEQIEQPQLWKIGFVMPEEDLVDKFPSPHNSNVHVGIWNGATYAVMTWKGRVSEKHIQDYAQKLRHICEKRQLQCTDNFIYSAYHPPWLFPWIREHDVMIEVTHD